MASKHCVLMNHNLLASFEKNMHLAVHHLFHWGHFVYESKESEVSQKQVARIACIILTGNRNWRLAKVTGDRIEYHATDSVNANFWRTTSLLIRSLAVCCTRYGKPIGGTGRVFRTYILITPTYAKWHGVWHAYCNVTRISISFIQFNWKEKFLWAYFT